MFEKYFKIIEETETIDQVVIKGNKIRDEVENEFGKYLDKVLFMPIIRLPNKNEKNNRRLHDIS